MQAPDSGQTVVSAGTGGSKEMDNLPDAMAERAVETGPSFAV